MDQEPKVDLGRLIRAAAMVKELSMGEVTAQATGALVAAYNRLRIEIANIVSGDQHLSAEVANLFPVMEGPPPYGPATNIAEDVKIDVAGREALLNLRQLGGWIQGLIDERTMELRMRIEAEEKAKLAAKPPTGFASPA